MYENFYQLDSLEIEYKKFYEASGKQYFMKPMTFGEFELLDPHIKETYKIMVQHHRHSGNNLDDSTAYNVFHAPDDRVEIIRHSRYSFPILHNHEFVELIYVYKGVCTHFIEDQELKMVTGDLCILAPNAIHAVSVTDDDTIVINILMSQKLFDQSFMQLMNRFPTLLQFFESILYMHSMTPYILYPTGSDRWMHELMYQIYLERSDKDYLYNECVALIVRQIFIHILRNFELMAIVADPSNDKPNDLIISLIGYITVNAKNISLQTTADFFGYNKSYLSRLLNKYTGKSFVNLVNEITMKQAASLLLESDMSITEIAQEYNCFDASHFNRKFTKIFHMSPNEYRKLNQQKDEKSR